MASKRQKTDTQSGSRGSHSGRGSRLTNRANLSSSAASSSAGFQTPINRRFHTINQAAGARFSRQGSVLRTSAPPSSPALPKLLSQKRASFRLPTSHVNSGSSSLSRISRHVADIESDTEIQDREDADALNEIIMAVDVRERGTLGCAYYIAREEKLFLVEDIKLADLDIIDTLKMHASPTVVLISTKSDETLEDHLMKEARDASKRDDPGMPVSTSVKCRE